MLPTRRGFPPLLSCRWCKGPEGRSFTAPTTLMTTLVRTITAAAPMRSPPSQMPILNWRTTCCQLLRNKLVRAYADKERVAELAVRRELHAAHLNHLADQPLSLSLGPWDFALGVG